MRKSISLLKVFIAFSLVYLLIVLFELDDIARYIKPLLLPLLLYAVQIHKPFETKNLLLISLLFSWLGDCVLLFADQDELYFIIGLALFLVAHLFLVFLFIDQKRETFQQKNSKFSIGIGLIAIYLIGMLLLLIPGLGDLKLPVTLYAIVISIMLSLALRGIYHWEKESKHIVFIGAISFVISDSILAIDKFYTGISKDTFWVMLTYLIAQFCITYGILKLNKKQIALH